MKVVAFDVRSTVGHFRRPDTTATHLTYPFITPTAARGLVGAILGIEDFVTKDKIGIQILTPVQTSSQQMSMLGKDGGSVFNRPTTIELLVNPAYRIYYAGNEYGEELVESLKNKRSVYQTYLGSAFAITTPKLHDIFPYTKVKGDDLLKSNTVVPVHAIEHLEIEPDKDYSRASGFMCHYLGDRTFEHSIDFIYEKQGRSIYFRPEKNMEAETDKPVDIVKKGDGVICLF